MSKKYFSNFKEANNFAKKAATKDGTSISLKREGDVFFVETPDKNDTEEFDSNMKELFHDFAGFRKARKENKDIILVLNEGGMGSCIDENSSWKYVYIDKEQFSSPDLSWTDHQTNLTWDISHLLFNNLRTMERSKNNSPILNKIEYAGYSNWRLPTIAELKTLLDEKQELNLKIEISTNYKNSFRFWSNEKSTNNAITSDYYYVFNFKTMEKESQMYTERKCKSTRHDGYLFSAITIHVRDGK